MILVGDSQAGALADAFVLVAKELEASYKVVYGKLVSGTREAERITRFMF